VSVPQLMKTGIENESFGGVTYHVSGELVPVLQIEVTTTPVYFEHHILLWKDPTLNVGIKSLSGGFKRILAGLPIIMTETTGQGRIAFSRDGAGHIVPIHLPPGQEVEVREHQFLAATGDVDYSFRRIKGAANMLMSSSGLFVDTFKCASKPGIIWLHGYGNIFDITLQAGEQIDIEPGGWVFKDATVAMDTKIQGLSAGLFGSGGQIVWNRFTGPGRVGIQSMSLHVPAEK
jgi:uncharacterized protein (AIM24 family)